MNKKIIIGSLIVMVLIIGGWYWAKDENKSGLINQMENSQSTTNSGENAQPGSGVHDLPIEPAAVEARKDLATKLKIDVKSIVIMQITEMTWSDGCLGLGQANESCLMALVPGFKIEMQAKGKSYFYRTDLTGLSVREETK